MTEQKRQHLWLQALRYEELTPAEQQSVDESMAADPDLRRNWERLRELEKQAACDWPLADEDFWQAGSTDREDQERQESLDRLLAAVPPTVGDTLPFGERAAEPRTRRRFLLPRVLWPLAAVLALVILLPNFFPQKDLIGLLAIQTVQVTDDGTRSRPTSIPAAGQLHSGQAFVLSLAPETSGWVVVYHVDSAGVCECVWDGLTTEGTPTIPPISSGDYWVLSGAIGTENFVVGAAPEPVADLDELDRSVAAACAQVQGASRVVEAVSEVLAAAVTMVRVLDIDHIE